MTQISSILVANRGEIARRVFRTARMMGLRCIAVYVDDDATAPHVTDADEAVRLPSTYLDAGAVLNAAVATGVEAIHPGYGFLAENAIFARSVVDAGLVWVGPPPDALEAMGDKIAAKRAAIAAGVPVLPSSEDPTDDAAVGYPLLVKAAAGGGGKGMRVVESPDDLAEAVAAAQREAASSFGDDRVFLERYVGRSRHIEIQIIGDAYGGLVHLGERECSIQRRHQKIIEEAPSPTIDEGLRRTMGEAALRLAASISYCSAGTVEFLFDEATREFFFLEVNTRLQVEHPVTEQITGLDLVREQIRIAAGEPLGYTSDSVTFSGHAIEARLYAEDPVNGFLPSIGDLAAFTPASQPAVRWDSGVRTGSTVGVSFDPMLAKVIAHAPTRREAAGRLALALERLHIGGVTTNRDFLAAALRTAEFLAGDTTTDFIDRVGPASRKTLTDEEQARVLVAGALWLQGRNRADATVLQMAPSGWRNARLPAQSVTFEVLGEAHRVEYQSGRDGSFSVQSGDQDDWTRAVVHAWTADSIDLALAGRRATCQVTWSGDRLYVQHPTGTAELTVVPRFTPPRSAEITGALSAPMPGVIIEVRVKPGQEVVTGEILLVLEAMKMEHRITAPDNGVVAHVGAKVGEQVAMGAALLVLKAEELNGSDLT